MRISGQTFEKVVAGQIGSLPLAFGEPKAERRALSSLPVTPPKSGLATNMAKIGRSAKTGRFTTVKKALNSPGTHVVETI